MEEPYRVCEGCHKEKPLSDFHDGYSFHKRGRKFQCDECYWNRIGYLHGMTRKAWLKCQQWRKDKGMAEMPGPTKETK